MSGYKSGEFMPPVSKRTVLRIPKNRNTTVLRDGPENRAKSSLNVTKKLNQTSVSRKQLDTSLRPSSTNCNRSDDVKEFEDLTKKLSYNDYIEALFLETEVDEKVAREKTEIDVKMSELATRMEMDKLVLRSSQSRLKDISFASEQQRIIDERQIDTEEFEKDLGKMDSEDILDNLTLNEDLYCDRLHLKDVDIGYKEDSAYEKLQVVISTLSENLDRIKSELELDGDEIDLMHRMSKDFKACLTADKNIDKNLEDCRKVLPGVSSNVLEVVSRDLSQIDL